MHSVRKVLRGVIHACSQSRERLTSCQKHCLPTSVPRPAAHPAVGTICSVFFFFVSLGLELSETKVYEP